MLGLGYAILCARYPIDNEPFAVLLPNVLVLDKKIEKKTLVFSSGEHLERDEYWSSYSWASGHSRSIKI